MCAPTCKFQYVSILTIRRHFQTNTRPSPQRKICTKFSGRMWCNKINFVQYNTIKVKFSPKQELKRLSSTAAPSHPYLLHFIWGYKSRYRKSSISGESGSFRPRSSSPPRRFAPAALRPRSFRPWSFRPLSRFALGRFAPRRNINLFATSRNINLFCWNLCE